MNRISKFAIVYLIGTVLSLTGFANGQAFWSQWGRNPQHTGMVNIAGQPLNKKIADIVYDPFVVQEQAESGGELLAHYQSTLIDGNTFYMMQKSGSVSFVPSGRVLGLRVAVWTQRMEPGAMECGAIRLAAENAGGGLDLCHGLEARAECHEFHLGLWRTGMAGSRSSIPRWPTEALYVPGRGWNDLEGEHNYRAGGGAHQSVLRRLDYRCQYFCVRPADGRCQRQYLLQRDRAEHQRQSVAAK